MFACQVPSRKRQQEKSWVSAGPGSSPQTGTRCSVADLGWPLQAPMSKIRRNTTALPQRSRMVSMAFTSSLSHSQCFSPQADWRLFPWSKRQQSLPPPQQHRASLDCSAFTAEELSWHRQILWWSSWTPWLRTMKCHKPADTFSALSLGIWASQICSNLRDHKVKAKSTNSSQSISIHDTWITNC